METPKFSHRGGPSLLFPPISFFSQAVNSNEITIDVHENYQKRSFRNKYLILSSNGVLPLSVPLAKGKNQQQNIKEVRISYDENWIKIHLDALKSAYGKSPYFEHYYPTYIKLLNKKFTTLYELNDVALRLIVSQLKIDILIKESEEYIKDKTAFNYTTKPYSQVFEYKYGFVQDLSIVDLLFNTGPEARMYL